jgi:predicted TIM-barrel fold metal-dependent hydrolase
MDWMISSDSHVVEPPDLWTTRVSADLIDRVPSVRREDGADWWYFDGVRWFSYAVSSNAGDRFKGMDALEAEYRFEDAPQAGYVPEETLKLNEADGIWASVLYPSTGLLLFTLAPEVLSSAVRAYNDWIAELCAHDRNRLKGIGVVGLDDVDGSVRELQRIRDLGLAGAMIPVAPSEHHGFELPELEPFWAAAEDLELPLSLHIATNRCVTDFTTFNQMHTRGGVTNADHHIRTALAALIFSGVFERHPRLRVLSVEFELGWAPHFVERMDYAYTQRRHYEGRIEFADGALPGDFFARNVALSFQEDPIGIELRHRIGVDNLLWGSDYPHAESTWPRSREILDRVLHGVPDEDRRRITASNTARVYGIDVPTPT